MRIGVNPEKIRGEKNTKKQHRVVVVFYIPNVEEGYYKESLAVLEACLDSLVNTVNFETTNITLINNNSIAEVGALVDKYIKKKQIEKYVLYDENKGKVYAVLNEVRGVYEEFVTISDADILFLNGWEKAVFEVYENYPKAGVVSPYPCPYLTFYKNQSVFGLNTIRNNVKYGKFVSDEDIEMYVKGTNLPRIIDRKSKFDWKEKQYILAKPAPVLIGAYHVVATYRTMQFRNIYNYPNIKFKNSYEENFIDCLADMKGMYRLSTIKSYTYHMGNTIDDFSLRSKMVATDLLGSETLQKVRPSKSFNRYIVLIERTIGRVFIKFKWNK